LRSGISYFFFQNFLKHEDIQNYSRFTDQGASIAERVIETIPKLLKKPVFEKGGANGISELSSIIKKYNKTIHQSIEMTPLETALKKVDKTLRSNLQDKRQKRKLQLLLG